MNIAENTAICFIYNKAKPMPSFVIEGSGQRALVDWAVKAIRSHHSGWAQMLRGLDAAPQDERTAMLVEFFLHAHWTLIQDLGAAAHSRGYQVDPMTFGETREEFASWRGHAEPYWGPWAEVLASKISDDDQALESCGHIYEFNGLPCFYCEIARLEAGGQ